jgi:hypothetical protein
MKLLLSCVLPFFLLFNICLTQQLPNVPVGQFRDDTGGTNTGWQNAVRYALQDARVLARFAMRVGEDHPLFDQYFVGPELGRFDQNPRRYYQTVMSMSTDPTIN